MQLKPTTNKPKGWKPNSRATDA